jgi:hypothetical protein
MSSLTFWNSKAEQDLSMYSKAEKILFNSIMKSFEMLEDSPIQGLINTMCSHSGLSETELLTNYDLFEKSLRQILYDGADIILDFLKDEMLQYSAIKRSSLTINDIMDEINSGEQDLVL